MEFKVLFKGVLAALILLLSFGATSYAGEYVLDNAHTYIGFSVKHMVIANVKGTFGDYTGGFVLDDKNQPVSSYAEIKVASIDTGIEKRDEHLRSADFFEAPKYPLMTFKSVSISKSPDGTYTGTGDLTIRGITKRINLTGTYAGPIKDPFGNERVGFSATGKIDRKDFGLLWNNTLETGGLVVGDEVTIILEGEGILKKK